MSHHRNLAADDRQQDVESVRLEALARAAYDAAHPRDSFEELKRRARFSKEASGLYRDWLRAARRGAFGAVPEQGPPAAADAARQAIAA